MEPGVDELFDGLPREAAPRRTEQVGGARLREPVRDEVTLQVCDLDAVIGEEHEARLIWAYASQVDLSDLLSAVKAREDGPGNDDRSIVLTQDIQGSSENLFHIPHVRPKLFAIRLLAK